MFKGFVSSYGHDLHAECEPEAARKMLVVQSQHDVAVLEIPEDMDSWKPVLSDPDVMASELILLGTGSDEEISQALALQGNAYVSLPVQPMVLNSALRAALRRKEISTALMSARDEIADLKSELQISREQKSDAIAEKDLTYRELLLAYSKLQDLNQQRTDFLLTATHELRTPVTVMKGYHRILLDGRLGELLPQQKEVLLESEQSCTRLIKIINSLLDLSRIEAGKLEIIYQECDLAANLRTLTEKLTDSAQSRRLSIILQADKNLPPVRCDRDKINQALTNLLEDVIKFAPAQGNIYISAVYHGPERSKETLPSQALATSEESENLLTSPYTLGPAILIRISNTGGAGSAEFKQDLLEQFNQTPGNQMDRSGLGLGLTITKRIIQAHGGKIWLDSEPSSGSCFSLLIPLNSVEAKVAKTIEG
jgi:signal transduction histidine kinase